MTKTNKRKQTLQGLRALEVFSDLNSAQRLVIQDAIRIFEEDIVREATEAIAEMEKAVERMEAMPRWIKGYD